MTPRRRRPRETRREPFGFEPLESRQVFDAAGGAGDLDTSWAAPLSAPDSDGIPAVSWVASDGWVDDSWWLNDSSWIDDNWWVDDSWWNDSSWTDDSWWLNDSPAVDDDSWEVDSGEAQSLDPVVVVEDPVVVAEPPASPPRRGTVPAVFGVARRFSSWIGMVMPGFGGSQGSGDSIGSSDSEFPGRGRSRSRLPFRPAS